MKFFVGLDAPHHAKNVPRAFISAHALKRRKSPFVVNEWILDSGAFTTIATHGGYPEPVEAYADLIHRFANCGTLLAAVAQDYMCEAFMLEKTGLTIADHQALTIERYDCLIALAFGAWVGVGSVCKRNGSWRAVRDVLDAILEVRPDLRLHAFGIKTTSLAYAAVRDRLHSADSMSSPAALTRNVR